MTILITGGAGYIGSQLTRDLLNDVRFNQERIRILDNMQEEKHHSLMDLGPGNSIEFIHGDIKNEEDLERVITPDVKSVVHLAAIVNAPLSFERKEETELVNYLGTKNIVDKCSQKGIENIVYLSTTSVYGETNGIVDENHECAPASPYGEFKLKAEKEALKHPGGIALRLGTVFGYSVGIRFHTVINIFAYNAIAGLPITVHGDGSQKRPFLHIKDVSRAIRFVLDKKDETSGEVFNVVGENAAVKDLISIIKEFRPDFEVEHTKQYILNQISYEVTSKKLNDLGFRTKYSIRDGVKEIIERFGSVNVKS